MAPSYVHAGNATPGATLGGVPLFVLVGARPELRDTRSSLTTSGGVVADVVTLTGLDAGALGRAALADAAHGRAARTVQAERSREIAGNFLDGDADAAASHFSIGTQLLGNAHRLINRNRKGDSHIPAGAAKDLRVDTDNLTSGI